MMKKGIFFCFKVIIGSKEKIRKEKKYKKEKKIVVKIRIICHKIYNSYLFYITKTFIFGSFIFALSHFEINLKRFKLKNKDSTNNKMINRSSD